MELENRAWGLESTKRMLEKEPTGGDLIFLSAWLEWELFLKEEYEPYARKYDLPQEADGRTRRRAGFTVFGAALVSDRKMMQMMLDSTIEYVETLRPIADVAPEEDADFFAFVVRQEEVQVEALRHRVAGEDQEGADVLLEFMGAHD